MTVLKICGIRHVDHALTATEVGASYIGFVFVPGVRRQLKVEQARDLIREYRRLVKGPTPILVGLFANQPLQEINHVIQRCGLDAVQLCGTEGPDYWKSVEATVIIQVRVRDRGARQEIIDSVIRKVNEVTDAGHIPLLDRYEAGSLGGTGRTFDWSVGKEVARAYEFLLAGGLTPDNVSEAITTVQPWGVDVSSGVETNGSKDLDKISAFAKAAKQYH